MFVYGLFSIAGRIKESVVIQKLNWYVCLADNGVVEHL